MGISNAKIRLVIGYLLFVVWIPNLEHLTHWDNIQLSIETYNWWLFWNLVLCVVSAGLIVACCRRIRQMPIFLTLVGLSAGWQIYTTLGEYWRSGFDQRFPPMDLDPLFFLTLALIGAVPFAMVYGVIALLGKFRALKENRSEA